MIFKDRPFLFLKKFELINQFAEKKAMRVTTASFFLSYLTKKTSKSGNPFPNSNHELRKNVEVIRSFEPLAIKKDVL